MKGSLSATAAGLMVLLLAVPHAGAIRPEFQSQHIAVGFSASRPAFTFLSADSLGRGQIEENPVLAEPTAAAIPGIERRAPFTYTRQGQPVWQAACDERSVTLTSDFVKGADAPAFTLTFNQKANHATLLGRMQPGERRMKLPCVLHLPDRGTLRITANVPGLYLDYDARRFVPTPFVAIGFPPAHAQQPHIAYRLEVVAIHPPWPGLENNPLYDGCRRGWLNIFQVNPHMQMLANNASSDPCAFTLFEYAAMARVTPPLAEGLTCLDLVRMTLDHYLAGAKGYGQVGYVPGKAAGDVSAWTTPWNSLDSLPSLLIAACDYVDGAGDQAWARGHYDQLAAWGREIFASDKNGNGLIEYPGTGNYGDRPRSNRRPANWWDTINFGHEDAYANALAYRAATRFAEIARQLGQAGDAQVFADKAARLRAAYVPTFLNPATGVLAGWKSADGALHDYGFTFVQGVAITYGLLDDKTANGVMDHLLAKMQAVGYTNFSLGLPGNLVPIRQGDYALDPHAPEIYGAPRLEDGSDGFQFYENGGATGCWVYFTVKALYQLGRIADARKIFYPMLHGYARGEFQGFDASWRSRDWRDWKGRGHGYEGLLVDNYLALLAVYDDLLAKPDAVKAAVPAKPLRTIIPLDGVWQIAEGSMTNRPRMFDHTVPVPGLVDLAVPPFVEPGPQVANLRSVPQKDKRRDAFWYRRSFMIDEAIPPAAILKVSKATYGTRVFLNGRLLGDHAASFTPGLFDAKAALKIGENELVIRVGADRDAVTDAVPCGMDMEKARYIPGIFDSVELILCGTPRIENVQVAPVIITQQARVRLYLDGSAVGTVTVEVREAKSGRLAGMVSAPLTEGAREVDLVVPLRKCRLWSPEDPFLYGLTARTSGDEFKTRFGMREFKFDPATGRPMLNGKTYFLRGTNLAVYRFFEDPLRQDLPWREEWVRTLCRRFKDMHWNSLRFHVSFPPEQWYRIADEEGILIQDEFPIWFYPGCVTWPKALTAARLSFEYAEWMRERWNHPCVVIWDASNETKTDQTGLAVAQVRGLDLSDRPWDNSFNPPARQGDVLEEHPYHFQDPKFKLSRLASVSPAPWGAKGKGQGVIVNEYGWLWLSREGQPTTLTTALYQNLLGTNATLVQRRQLYARYMAAETEFWRSRRQAAGVMEFCSLTYSRPGGFTSDHWLDLEKLTWEPEFYRYVRDAFAPVGLMIDAWDENYAGGKVQEFPVVVINDLGMPWKGKVRLRLLKEGAVVARETLRVEVAAFETARVVFSMPIPQVPGAYQVEAELSAKTVGPVRSVREFLVR